MPYTIRNQSCLGCDNCRLQCPMGAIKIENNKYWIDPSLCNDCKGYYPKPQCATVCPNNSPIPLQAKKVDARLSQERLQVQIYLLMAELIFLHHQ